MTNWTGSDVSMYQSAATLAATLKSDQFVIVKTSEGWGYVDPSHAAHVAAVRAAGVRVGHYHYGWMEKLAADEANHFVKTAAALPGELLALDLEHGDRKTGTYAPAFGLTWPQVIEWALTFCDTVTAQTKIRPGIYLNHFWLTHMQAAATPDQWARLAAHPLWFAGNQAGVYDGKAGQPGPLPADWPWTLHQYADKPYDKDALSGEAAAWDAITTVPKETPVLITQNSWPRLTREPSTHFVAPNGVNNNVSASSADLAIVAGYFVQWWNDSLETVKTCYGWRRDNSINPNGPQNSNHLSATAWDVNGAWHNYELYRQAQYRADPLREMGFSQAQLDKMRAFSRTIVNPDGRSIFRLGIDFDIPYRDPMHFEVNFRITSADIGYAADKIRKSTSGTIQKQPGITQSGDRGPLVASVQRAVGVKADGIFGKDTFAAVRLWQAAHKLDPDGRWGPASIAAYVTERDARKAAAAAKAKASQLRKGSKGSKVRELQGLLNKKLPARLAVDGDFGAATDKAVREFQKRSKVVVDGIVGADTAKALGFRL